MKNLIAAVVIGRCGIMRLLVAFVLLGAGSASADTFLIRSVDGGRTWTDIDPGAPHPFLYWLRVDPRLSNLYALTPRSLGGQLLVSSDRGQTWQTRQSFLVLPSGPWISRAAASAGTLYLAYEDPASIPQKSIMMARITNSGIDVLHYPAQGLTLDCPQPGFLLRIHFDGPCGTRRANCPLCIDREQSIRVD